MSNLKLLNKVQIRQKELGIKTENISKLTQVDEKVVQSFFDKQNIAETELIKITSLFGLDSCGSEITNIQNLQEQRAKEKALYIVSLVQDNSSLENQGLDKTHIKLLLEEVKKQFLTGEYRKNLWEV